ASTYYRYVSVFYPEGTHGGSGGVHVRDGYPHLVVLAPVHLQAAMTLAHEMTHASLAHLSLPAWVEEGLAQIFECQGGGRPLLLDATEAARHKKYWARQSLEAFWRGEGFLRPGKVQKLSYQLAEVLLRLLFEEFRPRWFGWSKEPRRRLLDFF